MNAPKDSIMKASQQTIHQIERTLRKVVAQFPADADPVMTDLHILVIPYTGEIRTYNDDDEELDRCVVEDWIKAPQDGFFDEVAPILRRCIQDMRPAIEDMSILKPFSFVLIDEDHETLQDLVFIDNEETMVLDGKLIDGLTDDLDDFLQHLLEEAGYEIVPFTQKADVYVINTCSVTNMADRKSRQMLHKAKKNNPDSIVVAAGCYVQTSEKEVLNDLSVDIVIGNDRKHDLVRLLEEYSLDSVNDTVDDINDGKHDFEELFIDQTKEHTRAFIKVQDGCNQFCSYCIIPYARGRVRSRRFENVIAEVERLAANGFKEVVLTGIHLSSYGVDFEEATGLLELIQAVNAVKGIERIRLGSLEPKIVTEHFASELSKLDKICPHFHLSLQSGCDATLKRMNRKYTTKEYERGCELLRKYFVHPAITTDVIVGFPGETEEEFEQTKAYLEHIHFYEMHIFKYSKRKGTRAAVMPDQIDEQIKAARSEKLIALGHDMSKEFRKFYIGKNEEVLFEEKAVIGDKEYFVGYTKEYVKVAKKTAENLENQIVSGRISGMLTDEILLFE